MERLKRVLWRGKLRKAATIVVGGFVVLVVIGAIASAFEEEKEDDKSAPPAALRSETSTPEPTEAAEPTRTPKSTATATPAKTPTATNTPAPTETPVPTKTPKPSTEDRISEWAVNNFVRLYPEKHPAWIICAVELFTQVVETEADLRLWNEYDEWREFTLTTIEELCDPLDVQPAP